MAIRSDRTAQAALSVARTQLDREWYVDLDIQILRDHEGRAAILLTNLGRTSVVILYLAVQEHSSVADPKRFPVTEVIPLGGQLRLDIRPQLLDYAISRLARPSSSNSFEQTLEVKFGTYAASRNSETEWQAVDVILSHHPANGWKVEGLTVPADPNPHA
jgi:hypothetical protein